MSTTVQFLLHSSLRGGMLILAVLLLRFLLHRIPKRYTCFLWTAVWLRLALPFAVRSRFSLLPSWLSTGQAPAAVPEQTATIAKPVSVVPGTAVPASTAAHLDYLDNAAVEGPHCVHLLDEVLDMKQIGLVTEDVCKLAATAACETSYRAAAKTVTEATGLSMSAQGVWNIVQQMGEAQKPRIS